MVDFFGGRNPWSFQKRHGWLFFEVPMFQTGITRVFTRCIFDLTSFLVDLGSDFFLTQLDPNWRIQAVLFDNEAVGKLLHGTSLYVQEPPLPIALVDSPHDHTRWNKDQRP